MRTEFVPIAQMEVNMDTMIIMSTIIDSLVGNSILLLSGTLGQSHQFYETIKQKTCLTRKKSSSQTLRLQKGGKWVLVNQSRQLFHNGPRALMVAELAFWLTRKCVPTGRNEISLTFNWDWVESLGTHLSWPFIKTMNLKERCLYCSFSATNKHK